MSEIAKSSSSLALPHTASEIGLDLAEGMSVEQWLKTGENLSQIDRACRWWVGDWLAYGESEYGERYGAAAAATGYSEQTLMDAVWVARKVPRSRRVKRLSFSHHKAVAKLEPGEQARHLADAARNNWSVAELRKRIAGEAEPTALPPSTSKGQREAPIEAPTAPALAPAGPPTARVERTPNELRSPAEKLAASASCAMRHADVLRALLVELKPAVESSPDAAKTWHEGFGELADIAAQLAEETLKAISADELERNRPGIEAATPAEEAEADRLAAKFEGLPQ